MDKNTNNRPHLVVHNVGGANLGNCYNRYDFEVTTTYPLTERSFKGLCDGGFLGAGQEVRCTPPPLPEDYWKVQPYENHPLWPKPAGHDKREEKTHSGEPITYEDPYFVYKVQRFCDSSD
jgi:hypothetical protein